MEHDTDKIVETAVKSAFEKKGEDITIAQMNNVTILCDYFIIITGNSRPHTRAIASHIELTLKEELGIVEKKIQGKSQGGWILMDYGTVVIHVFLDNLRSYYDLEGLWKEAKFKRPEETEVFQNALQMETTAQD